MREKQKESNFLVWLLDLPPTFFFILKTLTGQSKVLRNAIGRIFTKSHALWAVWDVSATSSKTLCA